MAGSTFSRTGICVNRPKFTGRRMVPGGRTWGARGLTGRRAARGAARMRGGGCFWVGGRRAGGRARGRRGGTWVWRGGFRPNGKSARTSAGLGAGGRRSACAAALIHGLECGWRVSRRAGCQAGGRPDHGCVQIHSESAGFGLSQVEARGLAFAARGLVKQVDSLKSWLPRFSDFIKQGKSSFWNRGR
jgi:hypothetical protein